MALSQLPLQFKGFALFSNNLSLKQQIGGSIRIFDLGKDLVHLFLHDLNHGLELLIFHLKIWLIRHILLASSQHLAERPLISDFLSRLKLFLSSESGVLIVEESLTTFSHDFLVVGHEL